MKTAEASSAMGISEPTLIRFCKALGFSGYQEFKINLSQQLAADDYFVMYEIDEDDSINELCEKVFDTAISEILNVRSQIDQNTLESAIEALANADRVEVYAFGGSAPVAMDAQHKFFRLKISSSFIVGFCASIYSAPFPCFVFIKAFIVLSLYVIIYYTII